MNAEADEQIAQAAEPSTPGELLKQERERRRLTPQQASDELHLDARVVEAIEANRFADLGAAVYARGHLRNYAILLGLPPERVIASYEKLMAHTAPPDPAPPPPLARSPRDQRSLRAPLIAGAIAITITLAWWLGDSQAPQTPPLADTSAEPASQAAQEPLAPSARGIETAPTGSEEASAGEASSRQDETSQSAAAEVETGVGTASAIETPAVAASSEVRIRLEFTGDCWTEVYDATGRRLMFGTGSPDRVRTLAGVAPIEVRLGAADAVAAEVDGRPIVIPRRAGKDSAKFFVDAAGAVSVTRPAAE